MDAQLGWLGLDSLLIGPQSPSTEIARFWTVPRKTGPVHMGLSF